MLSKLVINNFVIIEKIDVEFSDGLNTIIGETGSGKSILVDAIMLLFGDKASVDFIRQGETKSVIEATFIFNSSASIWKQISVLNLDLDLDFNNNEIIIRREISIKGNSRCFINDTPVNLATLKELSQNLVDFHGQSSNYKLLDKNNQLIILDDFSLIRDIKFNYTELFTNYQKKISEYQKLLKQKKEYLKQSSLFNSQLEEIVLVSPKLNEDIQLRTELDLLENSETLFSLADSFSHKLDSTNNSFLTKLYESKKILDELLKFDKIFEPYYKEIETSIISIAETEKFVRSYKNNIEFNPIRAEEIRARLSKINRLKNKFGSIEEIIELKNNLEQQLQSIHNYDYNILTIQKELACINQKLTELAIDLHNIRCTHAKKFETKVVDKLFVLGIENAVFEVNFDLEITSEENFANYNIISARIQDKYVCLTNTGYDIIKFYISTNKGESMAPLSETASGGEVSRIMLAIKSIIAETDKTPILIFDEIDTGISGRIAQKVGLAMRDIANYHQVITITHLPQIAAISNNCVVIYKQEENNRTVTTAQILSGETKILEIAKMLSGETLSEAAIESARNLINI